MQTIRELGDRFVEAIEHESRLDPLVRPLHRALHYLFGHTGRIGQLAKNLLSGQWFGHPVHPPLTDVPIGAWSAAVVLDGIDATTGGSKRARDAANLATIIGCVGAVPTAISGAHDWQYLDPPSKRIGLVHALLNSGALSAFAGSLAARRPRQARCLRCAGYTLAFAGAYLGGHLVYRRRIGVDHSDPRHRPRQFVPVLDDAELEEGKPRRVRADGIPIVLVRHRGGVYALGERCAHLGGPLSEGEVVGDTIACPWHGSRFALADGHLIDGPATGDQPCFETRVRDGKVEVRWVENRELEANRRRRERREREGRQGSEGRDDRGRLEHA